MLEQSQKTQELRNCLQVWATVKLMLIGMLLIKLYLFIANMALRAGSTALVFIVSVLICFHKYINAIKSTKY